MPAKLINDCNILLQKHHCNIFAAIMDIGIFLTLLVFCLLFLGGGAMVVNGLLTGKKKQLWWGLGMLALCLVLMLAGFYA